MEWQGKIILISERISFSHVKVKVCTTCNFQRRRNYNFSVKHGRRTLYHLNAEVFRMKFSHLKLLATKYMFNLQKEWILWREKKKKLELSPVIPFCTKHEATSFILGYFMTPAYFLM